MIFRQNPLKFIHDFAASIARSLKKSYSCGKGSELLCSHFCHCMIWISPPKKQSGVINYCKFPIHKRGSSWKCTPSHPLLQNIHCEEITAQTGCFLFLPGWLLLGMTAPEKPQSAAPLPQYVISPDPSTVLPLTTLKNRTFHNPSCSDQLPLYQQSTICFSETSKDGL